MAKCPAKSPERRGGDYTDFFFFLSFFFSNLYVQILELEKKMARQNRAAVKVKQANSSKQLQKQIETLELHLNNVSKHFADLRRPCVGPHRGLCATPFLARTKCNAADAFG